MEITSIRSFLDYHKSISGRTYRLIKLVEPGHIDFSYKPGKFTVGDQIRHIAAIERYLFAEIVAGRQNAYLGCGKEFGESYPETISYYNGLRQQSLEILKSLRDEDLQKKCMTPEGSEITAWKWLRAMIEHEIHHRAQLYLYLNMLKVKTPPLFGLTAEEVIEKSGQKNNL